MHPCHLCARARSQDTRERENMSVGESRSVEACARFRDAIHNKTKPTVLADFLLWFFVTFWCLIDGFHLFLVCARFFWNSKIEIFKGDLRVMIWHHFLRSHSTICYFYVCYRFACAHIYANCLFPVLCHQSFLLWGFV